MPLQLQHDLKLSASPDDLARENFVASLRQFILDDMATGMRQRYEDKLAPSFERSEGRKPQDGPDVHRLMKGDTYFKFYSSMRYNAQEMVWRTVIPEVEQDYAELHEKAAHFSNGGARAQGTLELDPDFDLPRNVTAIDVHLAPGCYHTEYTEEDLAAGAVYDNGLRIFSFGQMGKNLDDIGWTFAQWVKHKFPDFAPTKILDSGCTIGHNTLPWAQTYPDAEVTGIDVAAPCLRYAHARAQAQGVTAHFKQMNATQLDFEDDRFDVVFSSMFLHELSLKDIRAYLREAYRVLKPGGMLITMELPPNNQMGAYDSFYLDWDCYYNNEPFYKAFRDRDTRELIHDAGFGGDDYFQFISPQYTYNPPEVFAEAVQGEGEMSANTGRLTTGVQWFGFGAWKR